MSRRPCGINPQVILVTLQKEEGLVLSSAADDQRASTRSPMGYGCPDTSRVQQSTYFGFFNQVYERGPPVPEVLCEEPQATSATGPAASRTSSSTARAPRAGRSASVYIQNQATASLYNYTPYTPNAAALAAGYGSATCGAYGNRNFYLYFSDWFGNPTNWLASGGFDGKSILGWNFNALTNKGLKRDSLAQAGDSYLVTNTTAPGNGLSQTVTRATKVGEQVNASIWLRSSTSTPFKGTMRLVALGGSAERVTRTFTVGSAWTQVPLSLPARLSSHTGVRLEVAMTTTGLNLLVDSASVGFGQAPAATPAPPATKPPTTTPPVTTAPVAPGATAENRLTNPSFEGTLASWAPGNGAINTAVTKNASAKAGAWLAAANTGVAGRSLAQTVAVKPVANDRWTASVWLRASSSRPFSGKVALWGLGGSKNINAVSAYTVGNGAWTQVQVTLDAGAVLPTSIKLEVYFDSVYRQAGAVWFDSASLSKNLLTAGSFENSSTGWTRPTTTNLAVNKATSTDPAVNGSYFATTNTTVAGAALSQDVARAAVVGDTYTAEVWVRRTSGKKTFSGRLALSAVGSKTPVASKAFTAGTTWTLLRIQLPITAGGTTTLRFQLFEDTAGSTLAVDGAQVF